MQRFEQVREWLCGIGFCFVTGLSGYAGSLQDAWKDVEYLDYRRATPQFQKLQKAAIPGSTEWREATLGLALCLHQRQPDVKADKEQAAELYDALISGSDGVPIQATGLLLRGKLAQLVDYFGDEEDFSSASRFYGRVLRDWPDSLCAGEAALYLAQCEIFTMDKTAALKSIEALEAWVAAHPDNPYAASHWLLISLACRMPLEDVGRAVDASVNALAAGLPEEMSVDLLYWRIGTMSQKAGMLDVARDFYTRIIVDVQRSAYTYMAQQRIKAMGFDPPELVDPFEN